MARRCLGYERVSREVALACTEPASVEYRYGVGFRAAHYRCARHVPPAGWFAGSRPLGEGQLAFAFGRPA